MSAGQICSRVVVTASPWESVRAAAQRMAENGVGTVVVTNLDGAVQAAGIVTDRDIALRCVAGGFDPDRTPVSSIMTNLVISVDQGTPIDDAMRKMAGAGTRRLVVTGPEGGLVGILSLDDVLDVLVEEITSVGKLLKRQAVSSVA